MTALSCLERSSLFSRPTHTPRGCCYACVLRDSSIETLGVGCRVWRKPARTRETLRSRDRNQEEESLASILLLSHSPSSLSVHTKSSLTERRAYRERHFAASSPPHEKSLSLGEQRSGTNGFSSRITGRISGQQIGSSHEVEQQLHQVLHRLLNREA